MKFISISRACRSKDFNAATDSDTFVSQIDTHKSHRVCSVAVTTRSLTITNKQKNDEKKIEETFQFKVITKNL
jgi:hypothetical protein